MIGCAIERVGTWCRYVALNKRALEDAELFAKIGRIRTPSPPALSDEGLEVVDLYVWLDLWGASCFVGPGDHKASWINIFAVVLSDL